MIKSKNGLGINQDINLEEEVKLIQEKKSRLSARQRQMIVNLWEHLKENDK